MNSKVSPTVSIPMKDLEDTDIPSLAEDDVRCKKCQLVKPCNCSSDARRVSEVKLLSYELSEKQELANETVRGMQTRKRKSTGKKLFCCHMHVLDVALGCRCDARIIFPHSQTLAAKV